MLNGVSVNFNRMSVGFPFDSFGISNLFLQLINPGFFNKNPLEVSTLGMFYLSLFDFQLGLLKSNRKTMMDFLGFMTLLIK